MPDAKYALDVIPNRSPESRRIHVRAVGHRAIRQIVGGAELVVQQIAHIVVQPIDQRVAVVVPRVVLDAERARDVLGVAAPLKVLVREIGIVDQVADDLLVRQLGDGRRGIGGHGGQIDDGRKFGGLKLVGEAKD